MLKRNKGFTFIELLLIIVILGILVYVSISKYLDLSTKSEQEVEKATVENINMATQLIYAEGVVQTGIGSYPATLDSATAGMSSPSNPFFTNVLQTPYQGGLWEKTADGQYIGPAGNTYEYNSSDGHFKKQD